MELLRLNDIGYETADAILLFAGNHLIFPASRLVARVLERIGFDVPKGYEALRKFIESGYQRTSLAISSFTHLHSSQQRLHVAHRIPIVWGVLLATFVACLHISKRQTFLNDIKFDDFSLKMM